MKTKIIKTYLTSILLTVFTYFLPIDFGNSIFHWILAAILGFLYFYMLRLTFQSSPEAARINIALWLTNTLALLHLTLIYLALVFSSVATLIVGGVLGAILYYVVKHQVDQKIEE